MAVIIENALTGNGNLKTDVHKNIREQVAQELLIDTLGLESTPNGDFAIQVAEADGRAIYARFSLVITMADPFVEKPKATKKAKEKEVVVVPRLF